MLDRKRRKVALTVETGWLLGDLLQNELRDDFYFDLADGRIVQAEDWDNPSEKQKFYDGISTRYLEIPRFAHGAVHALLDEFWDSLDDEAKTATADIRGVGDTLYVLEAESGIDRGRFLEFVARRWLEDEDIEPVIITE